MCRPSISTVLLRPSQEAMPSATAQCMLFLLWFACLTPKVRHPPAVLFMSGRIFVSKIAPCEYLRENQVAQAKGNRSAGTLAQGTRSFTCSTLGTRGRNEARKDVVKGKGGEGRV